jgi:integrase
MDGARYLEDGRLTIFRRSGVYYARVRTTGSAKYIWRSLKTSNEETAVQLGRRLLFQLEHRSGHGLPPKSKLFTAVIDDYVRYRERDHAHGRTSAGMLKGITWVSNYWRGYAGHLPVEDIDDQIMREFIPWRREYYAGAKVLPRNAKLHPSDQTLKWEMSLGKAIVRWATERGLRGNQPHITATYTPKKKRVRPAFELSEFQQLWRVLCRRIKSARNAPTRSSRELLRYYVLVVANSGLRPGEANDLRVRDVHPFTDEKGRRNFRFVVRGKTGERDVIVRAAAAKRIDKLLTERMAADPTGYLLAMSDGSRITTLMQQLVAALKAASLERNSFGERYSIYSFRHFYAVNALRNGVGVFEVARNMGTSVQMIQEYYGKQATPTVFATRLGD